LIDALELTLLVARKDPRRHPRVAARWLQRYLDEDPAVTIEEAALAASSLAALPGAGYLEAAQTLKAMAETATRRRRAQGIRPVSTSGLKTTNPAREVEAPARRGHGTDEALVLRCCP
jgi:hypothetical protein